MADPSSSPKAPHAADAEPGAVDSRPGALLGGAGGSTADRAAAGGTEQPEWLRDLRAGHSEGIPSLVEANLCGLDLSGLDLAGAQLVGANLSGANLQRTRLFGANLQGALLMEVDATGAEFAGADLTRANLARGTFDRAGFGSANLTDVIAHQASFRGATLTASSARNGQFASSDLEGLRGLDANLEEADFQAANLEGADISGSHVAGATFRRAQLKGAKLAGLEGYVHADWIFAELDNESLVGGVLLREFVKDQNFLFEFRNQSKWHEWTYRIWWVTSDCGRSVLRWAACSFVLSMAFAVLYTFVELDYGANRTWLSPFYFSIVTFSTLGFGDILPVTVAAQAVVIVEVILGYVMLGGMLSLISNKLARRVS